LTKPKNGLLLISDKARIEKVNAYAISIHITWQLQIVNSRTKFITQYPSFFSGGKHRAIIPGKNVQLYLVKSTMVINNYFVGLTPSSQ